MKRYKLRKYEMPRMVQTNLETEGFLCQSFGLMISADPLNNLNSVTGEDAEPMYLEY